MARHSSNREQNKLSAVTSAENILEYTYKKSKRSKRNLRLSIGYDGQIRFTIPALVSDPKIYINSFIEKNFNWILKRLHFANTFKDKIILKRSRKEYLQHRENARELIHSRIAHFNVYYNFVPKRISVKNIKSRWGSCSKRGNLNFTYLLALLPKEFADYVIVHELCHLGEFNHLPQFWSLVEKTIPDYKRIRKELKTKYVIV